MKVPSNRYRNFYKIRLIPVLASPRQDFHALPGPVVKVVQGPGVSDRVTDLVLEIL